MDDLLAHQLRKLAAGGMRWDDKIESLVVKEKEGQWLVSVTPMLFNDRVILTYPNDYPYGYTAGWCYDKGLPAILAALAWDPNTQWEPVGYKKKACDSREMPNEWRDTKRDVG